VILSLSAFSQFFPIKKTPSPAKSYWRFSFKTILFPLGHPVDEEHSSFVQQHKDLLLEGIA